MKWKTENSGNRRRSSLHSGVTLVEVLVSIAIMSIGVVLLSTLLPISILRTAQATQLTQSVFLRNNVEAAIEAFPGILSNSNTVFPPTLSGSPPTWLASSPPTLAVVDPYGFSLIASGVVPATIGGVQRYPLPSGLSEIGQEQIAALPDSWSDVFESPVKASSLTDITLTNPQSNINPRNSANRNNTSLGSQTNANYRLVMFDSSGKFSVIRDLLKYSNPTTNPVCSWSDGTITEPQLPSGFVPSRARIQVQSPRFTWLLTITKDAITSTAPSYTSPSLFTSPAVTLPVTNPWAAELNVAIFYNRSFKATDEQTYPLNFVVGGNGMDGAPGIAGVDDDGINGVDDAGEIGWPGSDDNRTVTYTGTPYLKKGSYVLETSLLKWYRIVDFSTSTSTVLLDRDFRTTTVAANGVFLRGIVEVYPLGVRTGQY